MIFRLNTDCVLKIPPHLNNYLLMAMKAISSMQLEIMNSKGANCVFSQYEFVHWFLNGGDTAIDLFKKRGKTEDASMVKSIRIERSMENGYYRTNIAMENMRIIEFSQRTISVDCENHCEVNGKMNVQSRNCITYFCVRFFGNFSVHLNLTKNRFKCSNDESMLVLPVYLFLFHKII